MLSDACTKAFEATGLTSPRELMKKGMVIGHFSSSRLKQRESAVHGNHRAMLEAGMSNIMVAHGQGRSLLEIIRNSSEIQ